MNELPITEIGAGGILAYLLLKECLKGVRLILERRNGRRNGPACRPAGTEERPPVCDSEVKSALQENGKALASIGERLSHVHEQLGEINSHIAGIWKRLDKYQERVTRLETMADSDPVCRPAAPKRSG